MDIDPLADTVPPRYAVESDEEEDEYNPLSTSASQPVKEVNVKLTGDIKQRRGRTLVVATGHAAKIWAKGANLGEQIGGALVNGVQVALIFSPSWTQANIVVSEATTRLPVWAMHTFAEAIIEALGPSSVALLDEYAAPAYINAAPISFYDAPIRYLCIKGSIPAPSPSFEAYAPPNLVQSTSASFMSILAVTSTKESIAGTLFLVPAPHIPPPPPADITPTKSTLLDDDSGPALSTELISEAHRAIFATLGEDNKLWEGAGTGGRERERIARRRGDVGDGGMYI
ncbi:hypothetical protein FIBSPDRAFT_780625 [Athelia psychrophila]|uniref:Proteasome assembly chaperone 1 n=1 Tax=Athelia psychrophila TaxID=1759441 RepID=A0A166QYT5_9AGAM|nr:hypothetical protein FIBSPDRAFT_780625 [Fibularhizoctonia sp. CBS 109695]